MGNSTDFNKKTGVFIGLSMALIMTCFPSKCFAKGKCIECKDYFKQNVIFRDIKEPEIDSVKSIGGNRVVVKFSEAITLNESVKFRIKINGKKLTSYNLKSFDIEERVGKWGNKIDIYLGETLKPGKNKLDIEFKDGSLLRDAAGFPLKCVTKEFEVKEYKDRPSIKWVQATGDGTVRIKFNRAMDEETSTNPQYFSINGKKVKSERKAKLELEDHNSTVVIKNVANLFQDNNNEIFIEDYIKDSYGNNLLEDTKKRFSYERDEERPRVSNVKVINSKLIRVKFSERVDNDSATDISNYRLIDEDGVDILENDLSHVYITPSTLDKDDNSDCYDINFEEKDVLTGGRYTFKCKDVHDLSVPANKMEDYSFKVKGKDDVPPVALGINVNESKAVIIVFNEAMESSTLREKDNFFCESLEGEVKEIPSGTSLDVSSDLMTVTVTFPKDFDFKSLKSLGVKNVRDFSGNELMEGALTFPIDHSTNLKPAMMFKDSLRIYEEGSDLKAEVIFDRSIDEKTIDVSKISIAGKNPLEGEAIKGKLILNFGKGEEAKKVKSQGAKAVLSIKKGAFKDEASVLIDEKTADKVHSFEVPPKIEDISKDSVCEKSGKDMEVTIKFDSPLSSGYVDEYDDDFRFVANDRELNVSYSYVKGNTLHYRFEPESVTNDIESVKLWALKNRVNIKGLKDGLGEKVMYDPTSEDIRGAIIKVKTLKKE